MRPFIEEVRSNVKSPQGEWVQKLGRYTYIKGPNNQHKAAVVQAVELGATGIVDNLMGRSSVKAAAQLMALKPEHEAELFSLVQFSDGSSSTWTATPGKKPSVEDQRPDLIVSRVAQKVMAGSTEKLHEAMLDWLDMSELSEADVTAQMDAACQERYTRIAASMRQTSSNEARILLKVLGYASRKSTEAGSRAKSFARIVEHYVDLGVDGNVTDEEVFGLLNDKMPGELPQLRLLQEVLRSARNRGDSQCPACSSEVGAGHLTACLAHFEQHDAPAVDLPWIANEVKNLFIRKARWENLVEAKRQEETCKAQSKAYRDLKAACRKRLKQLVEDSIESFCGQVNAYLPKSWTLGYDAKLGALGLSRDAFGFSFSMDGAEWATVTAAVGCVIGDHTPEGEPLVLVIQEQAWDQETLRDVMSALRKFPGQVLMLGTVSPRGRFPSGWTLVSSGELVEQFVVRTIQPIEEVSEFTKKMLLALGFEPAAIEKMSPETAAEISQLRGTSAQDVVIHEDGGWALKERV